ncbi:MAG TPA: acetyl-CoA carboxylase biotin carboxyl carrier protein subunit [Terracidiphilus sp.]|jgi:methylmalonyl-CoA carboxyltransferase small subunit
MKLRITIEGKTYDAEVEILEDEESGPPFQSYSQVAAPYPPAPVSASPGQTNGTGTGAADKFCRSPVTGLVIGVNVEPGQEVQPNDLLLVLEAMKMETRVTATHAQTVKTVNVTPGNPVRLHQALIEFE